MMIAYLIIITLVTTLIQSQEAQVGPRKPLRAIAIIHGEMDGSSIEGLVKFTQLDFDTLTIDVDISGFPKGNKSEHGMHVHEWSLRNTSSFPDVCGSVGPHFNPFNKTHGDIQSDERHVGDYGLIETDQNGIIRITKFDKLSKLFGPTSIIGRTIVIHHDADDLGLGDNSDSKSSGHSGSRVACGIIGIDKMD